MVVIDPVPVESRDQRVSIELAIPLRTEKPTNIDHESDIVGTEYRDEFLDRV